LVEALSPHCSEELFQQLEKAILNYHEPDEKRNAQYCFSTWKRGYFDHYWGKAQYFLLPALPAARVKPSTTALIQVLHRKFAEYSEDRFLRNGRSKGGMIDSKLSSNLEKISNRAWLDIVRNSKVKNPNNREWIQIEPDRVLETSVRQFSNSLETIAKRFPERFARLALQFPADIDPAYISAILEGCRQKTPDSNLPDKAKKTWEPANIRSIEALLERFQAGNDRETAASFCRLIYQRSEENWSDATLERLVHYAKNHPDPELRKLNVHCDKSAGEASIHILFQNTINCVRGMAARAIKHLLWEHPDLFKKLRAGIDALVCDHHPAVRMAAAEMLLQVLNIDRDQAVKWFVEACEEDIRVAASPQGIQFFNYTIPSHINSLSPIIQRMVFSTWDDVSKAGAKQVTARWLYHSFFENEVVACQFGTLPQRQGVAAVASQLLHDRAYSEMCQKILRPLMNDPDKEVRKEVRRVFNKPEFLNNATLKPFILEYVNSLAFTDDPQNIVRMMKDYTGSIVFISDTIFSMCDVFSSRLETESRDVNSRMPYAISETVSLLLRLYENALASEVTEIINRCLDIWDMLFQNRVGIVKNLTKSIEQ